MHRSNDSTIIANGSTVTLTVLLELRIRP